MCSIWARKAALLAFSSCRSNFLEVYRHKKAEKSRQSLAVTLFW